MPGAWSNILKTGYIGNKAVLTIINKTGIQKPQYVDIMLRQFCRKANIVPESVRLILGKRKDHLKYPGGRYKGDQETVVVRINRHTQYEDFEFVLAHEIGHLKQHRESDKELCMLARREQYATKFAMETCECNPLTEYSGTSRYAKKKTLAR